MDHEIEQAATPPAGGEPRCPQCAVVVQPTWDWCHSCGYDPDGLKAAADNAARDLAPGIAGIEIEPLPPAPPPDLAADGDSAGGGRFRRRRYRR